MEADDADHLNRLFPKNPYRIQTQIATTIYQALEKKDQKLLIIESPTGTGKSYSLLVPVLKWISENRYTLKSHDSNKSKPKLPSFLNLNQQSKADCIKKERQKQFQDCLNISEIKKYKKQKALQPESSINFEDIDACEQDSTQPLEGKRRINLEVKFHEKLENMEREDICVKLIFVSRTHSQLEQILQSLELIKEKLQSGDQLLSLTLGSKQNLCVNPQIKISSGSAQSDDLANTQSVSERCQYLLNHSHCQYAHNQKVKQFFGKSLKQSQKQGKQHGVCGYYGLLNLVGLADILLVPYASIIDQSIRTKIGINLNNSVIIFDQGHNLMELLKSTAGGQIQQKELQVLSRKISGYLEKYGKLMKISNKSLLIHFQGIVNNLLCLAKKYLETLNSGKEQYLKMSCLDFLVDLGMTEIKIHQIKRLFLLTGLDRKLVYFDEKAPQLKTKHRKEQFEIQAGGLSLGQVHNCLDWLEKVVQFSEAKKIVLIKAQSPALPASNTKPVVAHIKMKIFCLESNQGIFEILDQCRLSVIAGGTMGPLSEFSSVLSKYPHSVHRYPHIIAKEQCKIKIVRRFRDKQIRFIHSNLNEDSSAEYLQQVVATVVKGVVRQSKKGEGIVVFIQSYKLVSEIKLAFQRAHKQIFELCLFDEHSSSKGEVDFFGQHQKRIKEGRWSILFSVMGGKLSEGINFSDDLARRLIVFGLPYPSTKAPEIIEQMKFYDSEGRKEITGQIFYQNLCLKTLNQTIGRAIRHKKDWADIFLIDDRFQSIKGELSAWMKESTETFLNLEECFE